MHKPYFQVISTEVVMITKRKQNCHILIRAFCSPAKTNKSDQMCWYFERLYVIPLFFNQCFGVQISLDQPLGHFSLYVVMSMCLFVCMFVCLFVPPCHSEMKWKKLLVKQLIPKIAKKETMLILEGWSDFLKFLNVLGFRVFWVFLLCWCHCLHSLGVLGLMMMLILLLHLLLMR